ncbi:uncharacterized protein [Antedon mediterranea]|uniref:uncharacterized protein n=1 Tax=Antedon mediterranea TaxID=105859 RepID=UPI003AF6665E
MTRPKKTAQDDLYYESDFSDLDFELEDLSFNSGDEDVTDEFNCVCKEKDDAEMIGCENPKCLKWYHFRCVGVTQDSLPKGQWKCYVCTESAISTDNLHTQKLKKGKMKRPKNGYSGDEALEFANENLRTSVLSIKSHPMFSGSFPNAEIAQEIAAQILTDNMSTFAEFARKTTRKLWTVVTSGDNTFLGPEANECMFRELNSLISKDEDIF